MIIPERFTLPGYYALQHTNAFAHY